jgi:hypothetical protein
VCKSSSSDNVPSFRGKEVSLIVAKMPVPCEVRSKTDSPCPRRAVLEMRGVAFCGPCAREQEAYFAIGELTQDDGQGLRSEPLAEALERLRRERVDGTEGIAARKHHRSPSVDETEPLALTRS